MMKGLYILGAQNFDKIYGPSEQQEIQALVDIYAPVQTLETIQENPALLKDMEVLFSGWGCPKLDEDFLAAAPNLKAVFYGSGSIKSIVTDAFWERNILISSAYAANGVPVAEYTLSQILFSLKRGWYYVLNTKRDGVYPLYKEVPGAYQTTVGIISLGMIGRMVCEMLKPFDLQVLVYDPFVSEEDARSLGVTLCSLEEIFSKSDVVSLHTPWLKETEGMIQGSHFAQMKQNSTFINTSRGAVVAETEMIQVLAERPDVYAVLDVTYPEPPVPGSPLYCLPNVVLTPHIAGSMDAECRRMGRYMVEEFKRYLAGQPMQWAISKDKSLILA